MTVGNCSDYGCSSISYVASQWLRLKHLSPFNECEGKQQVINDLSANYPNIFGSQIVTMKHVKERVKLSEWSQAIRCLQIGLNNLAKALLTNLSKQEFDAVEAFEKEVFGSRRLNMLDTCHVLISKDGNLFEVQQPQKTIVSLPVETFDDCPAEKFVEHGKLCKFNLKLFFLRKPQFFLQV